MVLNPQQKEQTSPSCDVTNPSQQDLANEIRDVLRATGYGPLENVQVTTDGDRTVLSGQVETYFLKQLAGAVTSTVSGLSSFENSIEVS